MTDTTRGPAPDPAHHLAYRACRENITRLVTSDLSVAELPVPACPGWNVGDLVSHLVLVCRMAVDEYPGELSDPPPPPQGIPVHELVVTWAELEEHLPGVLARADWLRRRILPLDVLSHELDLRAALGLPPPDGSPALADALDLAVGASPCPCTNAVCRRCASGHPTGSGRPGRVNRPPRSAAAVWTSSAL